MASDDQYRLSDTGTEADPLRLVVVTHYFPSHGGGVELVAQQLCDGFNHEGIRVEWISSDTDRPPPDRAQTTYTTVASCNLIERLTDLPFPLWPPKSLGKLLRAISTSHVVHIHELAYVPNIFGLLFARLKGKKIVVTQHTGPITFRNRSLTALYRTYIRTSMLFARLMSARLVFVSDNSRRFFHLQDRSHLIFNGVDTDIFRPVTPQVRDELRKEFNFEPQRKIVLFVGRLVRKKGLPIVEALVGLYPEIAWVIVGSGPISPHHWTKSNVLTFEHLPHRELVKLYQASDLLILPSDTEGFPLVVQEALCCGLGVLSTTEVATACPPASALIRACQTRATSEPAEKWSDALAATLEDNGYIEGRTERAQLAHALWSWRGCVQSYLTLF